MFSHYHRATRLLFNIGHCETCQSEIIAPNAVKLAQETIPTGLTWIDDLPAEAGHNDDTGMECCEVCRG